MSAMSRSKHIDRVCAIAAAAALLICVALMLLPLPESGGTEMGYENRLFSSGSVHSIDILMDDWDSFIASAQSEEYSPCTVVVDGEAFSNVAIRGKGNTSLSSVASMQSSRYSFKIEFDHYETGKSYHGLDKLSLNNLIQDATYMKDYLSYTLMGSFGVAAPLCSYVSVSVNGELWGLYLAVEGVEDSFLSRNYGADRGELYKPDSTGMGGGRGQGKDFSMEDFSAEDFNTEDFAPSGFEPGNRGGGGGMASSDVLLRYSGDSADSYPNIFSNAKTDVSSADQSRLIASLKALSEGGIESAVDTEAVLRYFVVHNYVVNGDSYTGGMVHNYYLREHEGRLSMIPWDYNLAFGTFMGGSAQSSVNDPIDSPLSVGSDSRPMIDWIFESEEYTGRYHELFSEFISSVDIPALVEETAELIAPYVEADPTAFYGFDEFEAAAEALSLFCSLRSESVLGQLRGSIPSTSEGQSAQPQSLVDTGSLNLGAMGSMGGGMGGNRDSMGDNMDNNMGGRPGASMPGTEQIPGAEQMPDAEQIPGAEQMPAPGAMPQMGGMGGNFGSKGDRGNMSAAPSLPESDVRAFPQEAPSADTAAQSLPLIFLCALLLIAGIVIAWRYKR